MRHLLSAVPILGLSAGPAFAGGLMPPSLPSTGVLTLTAAAVVGAIFLARRKK